MSTRETPDPKSTLQYWIDLCKKLHEENERLKERLKSFYGY